MGQSSIANEIDALERTVRAYYKHKRNIFYGFFCATDFMSDEKQFKKHCHLAQLYNDAKEYDTAMEAIETAFSESDENRYDGMEAALISLLTYAQNTRNNDALEKAFKLQLRYARVLSTRQSSNAYRHLFSLYIETEKYDEAESLYRQRITSPSFDRLSRKEKFDICIHLGDLLLKQKRWEEAYEIYLKGERVASEQWHVSIQSHEHERLYPRLLITAAILNKEEQSHYLKKVLQGGRRHEDERENKEIHFIRKDRALNDKDLLKRGLQSLLSRTVLEVKDLPFDFKLVDTLGEIEEDTPERPLSQHTITEKKAMEVIDTGPLPEYKRLQQKLTMNWEQFGIGGYKDTIKLIIKRLLMPRAVSPEILKQTGIEPPNGALFYGPPGTGKTFMASRIGEYFFDKDHVEVINGPELFSPLVGNSEAKMRGLFERARRHPDETFVYIFDEIESLVGKRSTSDSVGAKVGNRMTSTLLTVLEGVKKLNNILVIGVTNFKENLDDALLRSGRMGDHFEIGLPNYEDRLAILRVHIQPCMTDGTVDPHLNLKALAKKTEGFSAADIKALKEMAMGDILESLFEFTDDGVIVHDDASLASIQVGQSVFESVVQVLKRGKAPDLTLNKSDPEEKKTLQRRYSASF